MALRFTHLALELAASVQAMEGPLVIREQQANRQRVFAANRSAARLGVCKGMSIQKALLLVPGLTMLNRDEPGEAEGLKRLAHWAMQFTSHVVLQTPQGLLLEIGASQRLFGGPEAIRVRVRACCEAIGHHPRIGVAPNPQAAWWLSAQTGSRQALRNRDLTEALGPLPLACLELPGKQLQALGRMGLYTLGDCLGLPRAGLGRRFGPQWLDRLDRALGRAPDPRTGFQPPRRFQARLELPAEVDNCAALLFGLQRLLSELGGALLGSDSAIDRLTLTLEHADLPLTDIRLRLLSPQRDPGYLLGLWRERLERVRLRAPVRALGLESCDFQVAGQTTRGLFGDVPGSAESRALWERLQARLGRDAVRQLGVQADHRPEVCLALGNSAEPPPPGRRPLWLLEPPEPLRQGPDGPWRDGPLRLELGPERIESGWWQGRWVRRDYFIATDVHGARLWLFRRADERDWYLHGLFG